MTRSRRTLGRDPEQPNSERDRQLRARVFPRMRQSLVLEAGRSIVRPQQGRSVGVGQDVGAVDHLVDRADEGSGREGGVRYSVERVGRESVRIEDPSRAIEERAE